MNEKNQGESLYAKILEEAKSDENIFFGIIYLINLK
jgi:hypothetical protein